MKVREQEDEGGGGKTNNFPGGENEFIFFKNGVPALLGM
jgi:hypothetical protein